MARFLSPTMFKTSRVQPWLSRCEPHGQIRVEDRKIGPLDSRPCLEDARFEGRDLKSENGIHFPQGDSLPGLGIHDESKAIKDMMVRSFGRERFQYRVANCVAALCVAQCFQASGYSSRFGN